MRPVRLLALALLAAGALHPPAATAATDPIQPGDYIVTGGAACTLNFVYDGTGSRAGKVYLGTAAHCVGRIGDDVRLETGEVFGDVAFIGDEDSAADDYAFIEVRTAHLSRVSPAVKGNLTYPKGVTAPNETQIGDLVQVSGYGLGFDMVNVTRERRVAVMGNDGASLHEVSGPIDFGDSGGPLVHVKTGKALGIVSRLCVGLCTEVGPTVQGVLTRAAAAGFTVTMRTV